MCWMRSEGERPGCSAARCQCPAAWLTDAFASGTRLSPATLLLQIHGLLPQRVRLLQQAILRRLVLLHVGLDAQEDVLVDERIDIVGIERKRLVVGGNPPEHVIVFDARRQPAILRRLL